MKAKKVCLSELAYVIGIVMLAFGTALMEKADFGMSMVVAPAYLVYLKLSQYYPAFTFGMAEYLFQAVVLVVLAVAVRRFKKSYLFSFVTAVIYGITLDFMISAVKSVPNDGMISRTLFYVFGMVIGAMGVAFLFNTYIAPEAYELFVKEISIQHGVKLDKVKTYYDCASCAIAILMSFVFFGLGKFEGVKFGTLINALINGKLIGFISGLLHQSFDFKDAFRMRDVFEK